MPAKSVLSFAVTNVAVMRVPLAAYGDCEQQLAELDGLLAETELEPAMLGGITMLRD